MIKIRKHKPPSRIRYEKAHPSVSFRLSRELKEDLEKSLEGRSFADFVKEALGKRKREKESLDDAKRSGYEEGYEEAKDKFLVQANCSICGNPVAAAGDRCKSELVELMMEHRWSHQSCKDAKGRRRR